MNLSGSNHPPVGRVVVFRDPLLTELAATFSKWDPALSEQSLRVMSERALESWLSGAQATLGEWMQRLIFADLMAHALTREQLLAWIETEVTAGQYLVFAAPGVQAKFQQAKDDRKLPTALREHVERIGECVSAMVKPARAKKPINDTNAENYLRRHEDGESTPAIADSIGESSAAVRTYYSRARKRRAEAQQ